MAKHFYFWIGVFATLLVSVPIAIGAWGVSEAVVKQIIAYAFVSIATLIFVLVMVLIFGRKIAEKLFGNASNTLAETVASAVEGASAAVVGDRSTAEAKAKDVATTIVHWYSWMNFYRWVIATCIGLLLAFGGFAGTVLLFEQNKKLSEQTALFAVQNQLVTLDLVPELRRTIVLATPTKSIPKIWDPSADMGKNQSHSWHIKRTDRSNAGECVLTTNMAELREQTNSSTMWNLWSL